MRIITCFLLFGLLFTNCTHRIVRTGYQTHKSDYKECDVTIKKDFLVSDTLATRIGEIKLGESGFSVACSEGQAIKTLKREACAVNADLIVITEENRPDLWSSCYRCRAAFYKYNFKEGIENNGTDDTYKKENVQSRVTRDRVKNTAIAIGSVVAGVMIGFLLTH